MISDTAGQSDDTGRFIPDILYEDNHVIVVNKPAGMLTQADAGGRISLLEHLKNYIKIRDSKPGNVYMGMVQRLDKPISGLLVFGKTSKGAKRISEQIRNRQLTKCYIAVTAAGTESDSISDDKTGDWREFTHRLYRKKDKSLVDNEAEGAQAATLQLKTLLTNSDFSFHIIRLITGRKHQIRAQLAALGMQICGDKKYGSQTQIDGNRILLHSYLLRMTHPTRETEVEFICSPPEVLLALFSSHEQDQINSVLGACRDNSPSPAL